MIYFLGKILPAVLNLFSVSIFVRLIGTKEYGKYMLLLTLILLIGNISSGWICQGILRFLSSCNTSSEKEAFKATISRSSFYSISTVIISIIIMASVFIEKSFSLLFFSSIILAFHFLYTVRSAMVQAELKPRKLLLAEMLRAGINLIVPLFLIFAFAETNYKVLLCGALSSFVTGWFLLSERSFQLRSIHDVINNCASFSGTLIKRCLNFNKYAYKSFDFAVMKKIWSYGWPMTLWLGISTLVNVSDRYLIKYFIDYESVGTYSAIYDVIYKSFSIWMLPITMAAHPMITKLWNDHDKKNAVIILNRVIKYQIILFLPIVPILYFSAPFIVKLILGAEDQMAVGIVLPVAIGAFLWQLCMLVHKPMELKLRTKTMVAFVSIALVSNIIGNVVLIPHYGFIAAAYTTILSSIIYYFLTFTYFRRFVLNNRFAASCP